MNNLQTTLQNCEQKIQHFFSYKIKLIVVPHVEPTLGTILDYVCLETGITKDQIINRNNSQQITEARQIYCYLAALS